MPRNTVAVARPDAQGLRRVLCYSFGALLDMWGVHRMFLRYGVSVNFFELAVPQSCSAEQICSALIGQ